MVLHQKNLFLPQKWKKNFIAEQLFWIKILEFLVDLFSYIYFVMKNLHQRYKNELSEIWDNRLIILYAQVFYSKMFFFLCKKHVDRWTKKFHLYHRVVHDTSHCDVNDLCHLSWTNRLQPKRTYFIPHRAIPFLNEI